MGPPPADAARPAPPNVVVGIVGIKLLAALHDKVKPVREERSGCPRELERIIDRCLEKQPRDRWRSAQHMVMALERFLSRHVEMNHHARVVLFLKARVALPLFFERALMLPYALCFMVVGIGMTVGWVVLDLPLGSPAGVGEIAVIRTSLPEGRCWSVSIKRSATFAL